MATADLTVLALGRPDVSASEYIAAIQRHLAKQDKVGYRLHPMGTELEGTTGDILNVVGELHAIPFDAGIPRVYTVLKLDERRDRPDQTLDDTGSLGRGEARGLARGRALAGPAAARAGQVCRGGHKLYRGAAGGVGVALLRRARDLVERLLRIAHRRDEVLLVVLQVCWRVEVVDLLAERACALPQRREPPLDLAVGLAGGARDPLG